MNKILVIGIVSVMASCTSSFDLYIDGCEVSRQIAPPTEEQVQNAIDDLDSSTAMAKTELADAPDHEYEKIAYVIPLANLAKAQIYSRLTQVDQVEREVWKAIDNAENYIGIHFRKNIPNQLNRNMYTAAAVYFRREKIRRQAFTILQELYREVGEKDLQALVNMQAIWSDRYLKNRTAQAEEENVRKAELAGLKRHDETVSEIISHTAGQFANLAVHSVNHAALEVQILQNQNLIDQNPNLSQSAVNEIRSKNEQLRTDQKTNAESMTHSSAQLAIQSQKNLVRINNIWRSTTIGAIAGNFHLIKVSNEIKQLREYQQLSQDFTRLDNYVKRNGFNEKSAQMLSNVRTTADQLVRAAQKKRAQKRKKNG